MPECFVLPWLVLTLVIAHRVSSTADGDALVTMMIKWGVAKPSSWTGDDPCAMSWEGVQCDINARVSRLNLTNKGLVGDIPSEISSLDRLVSLDLSNLKTSSGPWNLVTGDLSALSGLSNLQSLNFTFNVLNGGFPSVIVQFTGLTDLRLDNCGLTGSFPQDLSKLTKLQYLALAEGLSTEWSMHTIAPIHKSGDLLDPGNYRTMMIGHTLAKLYGAVLEKESSSYAEHEGLRVPGQELSSYAEREGLRVPGSLAAIYQGDMDHTETASSTKDAVLQGSVHDYSRGRLHSEA
ncbi:hypothetical protein L7F22_048062 [Adiantum nelumboides]|nr:hypothetical protein [Adiantum nelumboides]